MDGDRVTISAEDLKALAIRAFVRAGFGQHDADTTAEILITTDLMGISTHGVHRLDQYLKRIDAGVVPAQPDIKVIDKAASIAVVDGGGGQGQVVGARALETAIVKAIKSGIGFVSVGNSNHFGAMAPYGFAATVAGLILVSGTTASPSMMPFGGRDLRLGNNPIGFAAPNKSGAPFLLDMALSVAARGKMRKLRDTGEAMPLGWALDADGQPTTNPQAGLDGFIQFIGGHKGYGMALAVDILSGVLSGGRFLDDVGDMWAEKEPQGVSHFFLAINPAAILEREEYDARMAAFCAKVKSSAPFDAAGEVLLPGEIEYRTMEARRLDGIPLTAELLQSVRTLAGD
ncbi:MAG: Ldh family oxidoreductase [Rhodospirillaceae bacterium]|nr:Ldh family oxidoreductase [Rhodospirillaceae bacterium]